MTIQADPRACRDAATAVRTRVKQAVVDGLQLQLAPDELADDELLFGGLGADSTAALEIVVALEEEFGFEVEDEHLTEELLASVASLTAYVERAIGARDPVTQAGAQRESGVPDVPVILKSCPDCGRMLERVRSGRPAHSWRRCEAGERLGLELGRCPACGAQMTGRAAP